MANLVGKLGMKVLTVLVGIPVGKAAGKAVARAWTAARPTDPPHAPGAREAYWADVVGYAALAAAGTVIAKLVTRRGAEESYRMITGLEPPPPPPTKAEKKLAKAEKKANKKAAKAEKKK
jgi:hypothetical protein